MFRNLKTTNLLQSQLKADPLEGGFSKVSRQVLNAHFSFVSPEHTPDPKLLSWSSSCAFDCLDIIEYDKQQVESIFSGNEPLASEIKSWSLAYAGHQFGYFAGQLGDGRAISLAQVINSRNEIWEIQLKGAGLTPYSRTADGFAVLRSSIREYLCSEHMHHLGIPTSRALSLISSSRIVYRETPEQGAIVTRLAPSWIRFGSFELAFYRKEEDTLETLAKYVIQNFYPQYAPADFIGFFREVVERTAVMMSEWQAVGFCHGVMNTDNFSILGLTIDYGPFAFMDEFDPSFVCNHSDETGLYSYDNQPRAAQFNLVKLYERF